MLVWLPLVPDWAICCWSCEIMSSSFSLASRSLCSSSWSSCRSASARSRRQRSSHNCRRDERKQLGSDYDYHVSVLSIHSQQVFWHNSHVTCTTGPALEGPLNGATHRMEKLFVFSPIVSHSKYGFSSLKKLICKLKWMFTELCLQKLTTYLLHNHDFGRLMQTFENGF